MSEEEKQAIEETKTRIEKTKQGLDKGWYFGERFYLEREIERYEIILNLIDRLQKENEENKNLLNKTINYISIKEGTDFEETLKRFKGE